MKVAEFINTNLIDQQPGSTVIEWYLEFIEKGISRLGLIPEIGELEGFQTYAVSISTPKGGAKLLLQSKVASARRIEEFLKFKKECYAAQGITMESGIVEYDNFYGNAIYATSPIDPSVKCMVGVAGGDILKILDLSHVIPFSKRLRVLRQEWNQPAHLAANAIEYQSILEEYCMKLDEDSEERYFRTIFPGGYSRLYLRFIEAFLKQHPQPNEAINFHFTFGQATDSVLDENKSLIRSFYPHLFKMMLEKLESHLGRWPEVKDWERIDVDSVKTFVKSLAFLYNGALGSAGRKVKRAHLQLIEGDNGKLLLIPTPEWFVYANDVPAKDLEDLLAREFIEDSVGLADSIIFRNTENVGFIYGKGGACPLGGEVENGQHTYDVFTQFGYELIKNSLQG